MEFLRKIFGRRDKRADWEKIHVSLTPEAADLVNQILQEEGYPLSFGGIVTAKRMIIRAAREEFGPILTSPQINPLSPEAIIYLIEEGALKLDAETIKREYERHKEAVERSRR